MQEQTDLRAARVTSGIVGLLAWSGNEAIDGNGGLIIIWRRKMRISASTVRLAEVLYVSNWYARLDLLWGSDILKIFPYEGGVEEPLVY